MKKKYIVWVYLLLIFNLKENDNWFLKLQFKSPEEFEIGRLDWNYSKLLFNTY